MTELHELYYNDYHKFIDEIRNMSNALLLAELDDTVDFDIAQQIALEKPSPSAMIMDMGSDAYVFYHKRKRVFDCIRAEILRRLNSHSITEYVYLGKE